MGIAGDMIARGGNLARRYAEGLLKDVKPSDFARKPNVNGRVIDCNHPAWCYGHLAMYPFRALTLLDLGDRAIPNPADWEDLFKNGTPSPDDPAGTIFPSMQALTGHYFAAYDKALALIPEVRDEVFTRPNPAEGRWKELFPTVGSAINFLIVGHPQAHLGQVSTWRRCMGLPSAM
ncbi:MAG: DinB family protein [Phycisphaerales bacterium]|nr:DinB family protein [Phycisphaerales bacterium]